MKKPSKEDISKIMSHLGKIARKKHPYTKEQMSERGKLGAKKRWNLSTEQDLHTT